MRTILVIFLFGCFTLAVAQERIETPFQKGLLKNGSRFGTWEFFTDDKELELKIDLTTGKIHYQKPVTSDFVIQQANGWEKVKPQVYPVYALGTHNFYQEMRQRLPFPSGQQFSGRNALMFTIDSLGKARDFQVLNRFVFEDEILLAIQDIPNLWIPAIYDGKKYNSRFILPIIFLSPKNKLPEKEYEQDATILRPLVIPWGSEIVNPDISLIRSESSPGYIHKEYDNFIEEYEVDEKGKRSGIYLRYAVVDDFVIMLEKGYYSNDRKTGVWREYMTSKKNEDIIGVSNQLRRSGTYQNGLKEGIWEEFQMNWKPVARLYSNNVGPTPAQSARHTSKLGARGAYTKGVKTGPWLFFGLAGDTVQIYDYTHHTLIRDSDFRKVHDFNKSQSPFYEGGSQKLSRDLYENFDFRNISGVVNKDSVYAIFLISLDANGKTTEVKHLQGTTHHLVTQEIVTSLNQCDAWIPAYQNGNPIAGSNVYAVRIIKKQTFQRNTEFTSYSIKAWLVNYQQP